MHCYQNVQIHTNVHVLVHVLELECTTCSTWTYRKTRCGLTGKRRVEVDGVLGADTVERLAQPPRHAYAVAVRAAFGAPAALRRRLTRRAARNSKHRT